MASGPSKSGGLASANQHLIGRTASDALVALEVVSAVARAQQVRAAGAFCVARSALCVLGGSASHRLILGGLAGRAGNTVGVSATATRAVEEGVAAAAGCAAQANRRGGSRAGTRQVLGGAAGIHAIQAAGGRGRDRTVLSGTAGHAGTIFRRTCAIQTRASRTGSATSGALAVVSRVGSLGLVLVGTARGPGRAGGVCLTCATAASVRPSGTALTGAARASSNVLERRSRARGDTAASMKEEVRAANSTGRGCAALAAGGARFALAAGIVLKRGAVIHALACSRQGKARRTAVARLRARP